MTATYMRQCRQPSTTPHPRPRLRLKPKAPTTGYVDGAWWPHSDILAEELSNLLAVLTVRLGPIERVIYNLSDWAKTPNQVQLGGRTVQLSGYTGQPLDTIQVIGTNGPKLILLVIPPETAHDSAHDAMNSAAARDNAGTIEDLLRDMIENDG
ncbi:hypothetical protein H7H82_03000 [Mycobacterium heidelbergense]|uniref:Uncharacterized protein n=1 Tax=Mycobacterium heidelbergense TaxID=53376 RepID=A0A1X0DNI8_MYCHE|nr:DUF5994 family protein [Mycobacterium heidelbergense]MCV7049582.1 hypothetical protein [Mycobacterium heidelbergense]ORA73925.1 hypothetical protein BST25_11040 [Mycobacterium heidelbergense]